MGRRRWRGGGGEGWSTAQNNTTSSKRRRLLVSSACLLVFTILYVFVIGKHIVEQQLRQQQRLQNRAPEEDVPKALLNTRSILSLKTTVATDLGVRKNNTNTAGDLVAVANQHPKKLPLGLYAPHRANFTPAPANVRKKVCLSEKIVTYRALVSAYRQAGYEILHENDIRECHMIWFYNNGYELWEQEKNHSCKAEIQPWQRRDLFPNVFRLSSKAGLYEHARAYTARTGGGVAFDFMPETYLLYNAEERQAFADKLEHGNGWNMTWVLKSSQGSGGKHVQIVPPQSERLLELKEDMKIDRGKELYWDPNQKDHVQKFVCPRLSYRGGMFDIRFYVAVVSGDPLIAYYHDGVARKVYKDKYVLRVSTLFVEMEDALKEHVQQHPELDLPAPARADPLGHIRNQIKDAVANLILATREITWGGFNSTDYPWQNGFNLIGGDAMVDVYLQVHINDVNSRPSLADDRQHPLHTIRMETLVPMIQIVEEIAEKQESDQAVFPIRSDIGKYELVYTDDWHFTYDFERKKDIPCTSNL